MNLTTAQQTTLKTNANGQGSLTAAIAAHDWTTCVAFYNALSSPTVAIWRPNVTQAEVASAVLMSEFAALTAIKQNGLLLMTQSPLIDATKANIRSAFTTIFTSGTSLTNLTAIAQRTGTRLEILLASIAGPPATCGVDADGNNLFGQLIDELTFQRAMGF